MSTNLPPIEARVTAQERLQTILNARLEELGIDMQASFRELAVYHEQLDARIDRIDTRLDRIEASMATKDDLAAMETRILDAFQQLLTTLNPQPPRE